MLNTAFLNDVILCMYNHIYYLLVVLIFYFSGYIISFLYGIPEKHFTRLNHDSAKNQIKCHISIIKFDIRAKSFNDTIFLAKNTKMYFKLLCLESFSKPIWKDIISRMLDTNLTFSIFWQKVYLWPLIFDKVRSCK